MLNCIYHPTLEMQVVEDDEKERFLATGVWFAHPNEALKMRKDYEHQITSENERKNGRRKQ